MSRSIPPSSGTHITGYHPIRPGHGLVRFESKLESAFLTWVTYFGGRPTITSQPISVYWLDDENKWHKYTPDFLIQYEDSIPNELKKHHFTNRTIVEIKYADQAEKHQAEIDRKLQAVRGQGYQAILMTEIEIYGDRYDG